MKNDNKKQSISILGATGSIGKSALKVISEHPDDYDVFALSAHTRVDELVRLAEIFSPKYAVVGDACYAQARQLFAEKKLTTEVMSGDEGLKCIASHDEVDMVMAAIVGCAGLGSTYAALKAGKRVLLANKEALIMAGELMLDALRQHGGMLLPVDSEHNAMFQSLPEAYLHRIHIDDCTPADFGVSHVSLTASGGPFLQTAMHELEQVSVAEACAHPNWSMGKKISVDSATMMNKGLELAEACLLFGLHESQVNVVVHPQSVLHSAVHYTDGSVLAQLGMPDMCTPIASVMSWPKRQHAPVPALDFTTLSELNFMAPDLLKFRCLQLARDAIQHSQAAVAVLSAANEVAVHAFLQQRLTFLQIAQLNADILASFDVPKPNSVEEVLELDSQVRFEATQWLQAHCD